MKKNDVVQFNEKHRWCGCLGIISEKKKDRYMVGIPIPQKGTAYVFADESELERIGISAFVVKEEADD